MQNHSVKDFCKEAFSISIENMKQNTFIDVEDKNIKIKSFNIESSKVEYNRVNKVIRKKDELSFLLTTNDNVTIYITKNHKFFCKVENGNPTYIYTKDIIKLLKNNKVSILNENDKFILVSSIIKSKKIPIYDLEVNKVANYFTNGLLSHNSYVPMKTVPGGLAASFFCSMRFEVKKSNIKEGTDIKGVTLKVQCIKNKLGCPYLTTEVEAIFGEGIDKEKDLINECIEIGILVQGGAGWISYGDVKVQGVDKFKQLFLDNPEFKLELENKIKQYYNN